MKHEGKNLGVWVPDEIVQMKELNSDAKFLIMRIYWLDSSARGCYASNRTLGELIGTSERTVSRLISHLKQLELIHVKENEPRPDGLGCERRIYSKLASCLPITTKGIAKTSNKESTLTESVYLPPRQIGDKYVIDTEEEKRTTQPDPSGPAFSLSPKPFEVANKIARVTGFAVAKKGQLAERNVFSSLSVLDSVLANIYTEFASYTPESINKEITNAVGWLIRHRQADPKKDNLLFLTSWLVQEGNSERLELRTTADTMDSNNKRLDYARFLGSLWTESNCSISKVTLV